MSMFAGMGAVCCAAAAAARVCGGVSLGVRGQECLLAGFMRVRRVAVQRVRLAVGRVVGRVCRAGGHGREERRVFTVLLSICRGYMHTLAIGQRSHTDHCMWVQVVPTEVITS